MNALLDFCYKHKKAIFIIVISILVVLIILPFATRHYVGRGGEYTSTEDVARYIIKFHELPENYVTMYGYRISTEEERKNPNLRIGGDKHWNRADTDELNLSDRAVFKECDINEGTYIIDLENRGEKRLVYTTNVGSPKVYLTEDHYHTYTKISRFSLQKESNICWIVLAVYVVVNAIFWTLLIRKQLNNTKDALMSETVTLLNINVDDDDDNDKNIFN